MPLKIKMPRWIFIFMQFQRRKSVQSCDSLSSHRVTCESDAPFEWIFLAFRERSPMSLQPIQNESRVINKEAVGIYSNVSIAGPKCLAVIILRHALSLIIERVFEVFDVAFCNILTAKIRFSESKSRRSPRCWYVFHLLLGPGRSSSLNAYFVH